MFEHYTSLWKPFRDSIATRSWTPAQKASRLDASGTDLTSSEDEIGFLDDTQ